MLKSQFCAHIRNLKISIYELLLQLLDLTAELLNLPVLQASQLLLFQLNLLVFILQVEEQLTHLCQFVFILQLNHLDLCVLQPDVVLDQLPFPVLLLLASRMLRRLT